MATIYNPAELKINMRRIENGEKCYFIGNCDLDVNLKDTVLKFYPPKDNDERGYGAVVINTTKKPKRDEPVEE